jgi:c-di-GMP-binding flagellar brake protein YcgR
VSDRRRYRRVQAEVLYRPAGAEIFHHKRNTQNVSLGGMRVFTDEELALGARLDIDVLLSEGAPVRCWAEVVWLLKLDDGGPAKFDVGLRFTDMAPSDVQRLAAVLAPAG